MLVTARRNLGHGMNIIAEEEEEKGIAEVGQMGGLLCTGCGSASVGVRQAKAHGRGMQRYAGGDGLADEVSIERR